MRVDWVAVPKAMCARRVNRELSLEREAGAAARADAAALSGAREQRRRAERERQELEGAAVSERGLSGWLAVVCDLPALQLPQQRGGC
eukprot:COSAG01_NODE_30_length_36127_cov_41.433234_31_plen_88_part_00